jgi:uncharacterized protein
VAPGERLEVLDVLRGFAVFGILVVNMLFFAGPFEWVVNPPWTSAADRTAGFLIVTFFTGKFYSLFSMLFGFGFAIQMERADARQSGGGWLYVRRLLVLFLLGIAHAAFVWFGDILHLYAVVGLALLFFRRRGLGVILPAGLVALLIPTGLAAFAALAAANISMDGADAAEMFRTAESLQAYGRGTWSELTSQRVRDWLMLDSFAFFFAPSVLAMMLAGLAAFRMRILRAIERDERVWRNALFVSVVVGLGGNLFIAASHSWVDPMLSSPMSVVVTGVQAFAVPALAVAYASAIVLASRTARGARVLGPLAPVGRMALSNYLLQSIVATTIFYSYGLGWFGRVGPALTTLLAVITFAIQIPLSAWWMRRFRFGPAEWLWRSLAYGRAQPMRASRSGSL